VSLNVVQWSKSAGEQCVLCTVITRMLLDHIRIIVHMDIITFIILLLCFVFVILCYCVCNYCVVYCFERVSCFLFFVFFCVLYFIVLCIVVPLPPGTYPLAVNNNNIKCFT
jgi:hypothetical protein